MPADTSLEAFRGQDRRQGARAQSRRAAANSAAGASGRRERVSTKTKVLVGLFLLFLLAPFYFHVGPLRLSPYRALLIVTFVPLVVAWVSGAAGRIRAPDLLLVAFCAWACLALVVNHGFQEWQFAGIFVIETLGPYFLARCYIRTAADFRYFSRVFIALIAILMPLTLIESVTGRQFIMDIVGKALPVFGDAQRPQRWGLDRAQGPFEHPILYGVFCSAGFALAWYGLRRRIGTARAAGWSGIVGLATGLSLSMGAYVAIVSQLGLMIYEKATRTIPSRWLLLTGAIVFMYVTIDILSNRTPFEVFISYLTFNVGNAYNRVLIFEFGIAEVFRHPLAGIGLGEWQRPYWMSGSMDNFWLVVAVRYGVPAFLLMTAAFVTLLVQVGRKRLAEPLHRDFRYAYVVSVIGIFVAIGTVHLWNATYVFLMLLIGSGAWLLDAPSRRTAPAETEGEAPEAPEPRPVNPDIGTAEAPREATQDRKGPVPRRPVVIRWD